MIYILCGLAGVLIGAVIRGLLIQAKAKDKVDIFITGPHFEKGQFNIDTIFTNVDVARFGDTVYIIEREQSGTCNDHEAYTQELLGSNLWKDRNHE